MYAIAPMMVTTTRRWREANAKLIRSQTLKVARAPNKSSHIDAQKSFLIMQYVEVV